MIKWLWLFALVACGDQDAAPDAAPTGPSFVEADHGIPPQLIELGGPVLATPRTQPIFFAGDDTIQAQIEDFDAQLSTSQYWYDITAEYGISGITPLPTIVVTDPAPTTITALNAFLADKLDGTHSGEGWPLTIDESTIYSVFTPAGVVVHDPSGDSCDSYGAFHDEAMGAHGESIVYALLPRCGGNGPNGVDELTSSYSHELAEAATDPLVETDPAYGDADPDNYIMAYTPAAENGDYCENLNTAYGRLVGTYAVQRTWSNLASLAGKQPCVPAIAGPYVAAVPRFTEQFKLDSISSNAKVATNGVSIPVHTSKTIEVQVISDKPTDPFTVKAIDAAVLFGGPPELTFQWDTTMGVNGDVLHLTITRASAGSIPGSEFFIEGRIGNNTISQWWGYVAN